MVDRFIFVKLRDTEVANRAAIADHVADELAAAAGDASGVSVGLPADESAARWDLSIVVRVADRQAWDAIAARAAPLLEDWLPARAAVIKAWTFALRRPV